MVLMRSLLFVPADRAELIGAAQTSAADVIVLDLANVPPEKIDGVRPGLRQAIASLKAAGKTVHVRLNHLESGLTRDDLAAAVGEGLDGLVLPKTNSGRDIRELDVMIREQEVRNQVRPGTAVLIPQIGSAYGILHCEDIAQASTRIAGLSIDWFNYLADLGVSRSPTGAELDYARKVIVNCCAAYRLLALDARYGFADSEGFLREAEYVKSLGFKGKYVSSGLDISAEAQAEHIAGANRVFAVSQEA